MDQLLRYAAAGQLAYVAKQQEADGLAVVRQGRIAEAAGYGSGKLSGGANLSKALRDGLELWRLPFLDEIIGALAPDLDRTGGLSSLALRLSGEEGRAELKSSMTAHVPPNWTRKLLQDRPGGDAGVLIQASALLSAFTSAEKVGAGSVARIRSHYQEDLGRLVEQLILISAEPPTSRNYDAQILVGILASYAFEQVQEILDRALHFSPLGFRVWRAITKLVRLGEEEHADALESWVRSLVKEAGELRQSSLYAGRGLDLELAISVPDKWSPPGESDWAGKALLARAWQHDATIRERGTAVMGLWQRAIRRQPADREPTEQDLRELITEFRDGGSRPDAAAGLQWIAATLEHVMDEHEPVCKEFPEVDQRWFRCVQEAAAEISVPEHLLEGTRNLFRHMVLQNAGVYRRQAIETVITSGWNEAVAKALGLLLERETGESWLRVRAVFALGLMQRQSVEVQNDLTAACLHAHANLLAGQEGPDGRPSLTHIREMQASLFAVGDCFGVAGAEGRTQRIRHDIERVLTSLAGMEGSRGAVVAEAARAAAYALVMTAQPSKRGDEPDSKGLLEKLSRHPDSVTAEFSKWALGFRFADGEIRPLLDAPLGRDASPADG